MNEIGDTIRGRQALLNLIRRNATKLKTFKPSGNPIHDIHKMRTDKSHSNPKSISRLQRDANRAMDRIVKYNERDLTLLANKSRDQYTNKPGYSSVYSTIANLGNKAKLNAMHADKVFKTC